MVPAMNSPYRFSVAVLALAALFLTGCVGSAGPPPDYYLLTARASPADTGTQ